MFIKTKVEEVKVTTFYRQGTAKMLKEDKELIKHASCS
jgi:hypothetical protein